MGRVGPIPLAVGGRRVPESTGMSMELGRLFRLGASPAKDGGEIWSHATDT